MSTAVCAAQDGEWVGAFDYRDHELRFNFEIAGENLTLINGIERVNQKIQWKNDSFHVDLQPFDAFLKGRFDGELISGVWEKPYRGLKLPFTTQKGNVRYPMKSSGMEDARWKMTLNPDESGKSMAVGTFSEFKDRATMNIRTEVGDYRYFEGVVTDDSVIMSQFDGTHAFLVVGNKNEEGWRGKLYYDPNYTDEWVAEPDDDFDLTDPFAMEEVEKGKHQIYYDLLAAGSGKNAIDLVELEGKVVVIQVFGTWCPNSLDETLFLRDWYAEKPQDVEVIAVTYEPVVSESYGLERVNEYVSQLKIPYDVFVGGRMSKSEAALPFPFLKKIKAFPTTVLVDKKGYARYVHSYFNGPATGDYYESFQKEFKEKVAELVNE